MAERENDLWWIGYAHHGLGRCHGALGHRKDARRHFNEQVRIGRILEDPLRVAHGLVGLAVAVLGFSTIPTAEQAAEAFPHAREALNIYRTLDPQDRAIGESSALEAIAWHTFYQPGGYADAVAQMEASIAIMRRIDFAFGQGRAWVELGRIQQKAGAGAAGVQANREALRLAPDHSTLQVQAMTGLSVCYRLAGDHRKAEQTRLEALRLLEAIASPGMDHFREYLQAPIR
jgi:tetratricopeptide (TPR) repeat protein